MFLSIWNPLPELEDPQSHKLPQCPVLAITDDDDDNGDNDDPDEFNSYDLEASPTHGLLSLTTRSHKLPPLPQACTCGWLLRLFFRRTASMRHRWARLAVTVVSCLLAFTAIFNPSYTRGQYPENYCAVTDSVRRGGGKNPTGFWRSDVAQNAKTTTGGRGNPLSEKVYIAANIVDAELVRGVWGDAVLELMDLLGEQNVFLSIFENDSGPATRAALGDLAALIDTRMPLAGHSIISTTVTLESIPRVTLPSGETRVKRISYLSELRNRAMLPFLGTIPSLSRWGQPATEAGFVPPAMPEHWVQHPAAFHKVLFLNDVVFDPEQALHLLFSTNRGAYTAACGLDFINPFKFYDTFATRDTDGFIPAVPFFPFFAPGRSRTALEAGIDAVPAKSCWGGIAAFDAAVFRRPLLFRAEETPFWDASECCLIHADIAAPEATFVNPFVRVAYGSATFAWLPLVSRVERLFAGPHYVVSKMMRMPWGSERREDGAAGFCGSRKLLVMKKGVVRGGGGREWEGLLVPEED